MVQRMGTKNIASCMAYSEGYPNRLAALTIDNPQVVSLHLQEIKEDVKAWWKAWEHMLLIRSLASNLR